MDIAITSLSRKRQGNRTGEDKNMCNFTVGQKVVCKRVKLSEAAKRVRFKCPLVGGVYTIRAINDWGDDYVLLRFHELDNSDLIGSVDGYIEPGFCSRYFEPLVERKTDISALKSLLNTKPHDKLVEA